MPSPADRAALDQERTSARALLDTLQQRWDALQQQRRAVTDELTRVLDDARALAQSPDLADVFERRSAERSFRG